MAENEPSSTAEPTAETDSARGRWGVTAVVAVGILIASILPGGGTSVTGPVGVVGLDKWFHAVGYLALGASATWATSRPVVGSLGAIAYGLVIELVQYGLPYRMATWPDAAANAVGAVAGTLLYLTAAALYDARTGDVGDSDATEHSGETGESDATEHSGDTGDSDATDATDPSSKTGDTDDTRSQDG